MIPTSAAARRFAISASRPCLDPCVYDPPAIVDTDVVGQYLRELIPVAGCEVRHVALGRLACRVFEPWRQPAQLVEFRECGVEVCLVEQLTAAEQVAFEHENPDVPPLGLESLLRDAMCSLGDRPLQGRAARWTASM